MTAKKPRGRPIKKGQKLNTRTQPSEKRRLFAKEYLVDLNQTAAAKRAGYSERTAKQSGYELLRDPAVQEMIRAEMVKRERRTEITQDRVLQELARVAFFDPRRLLNPDGTPKPINELDDDTAAVLVGLDIAEEWEGTGRNRRFVGYTRKVKLSDKVGALSLAMRHLGMLKDKLEVTDTTPRAERLRQARDRTKGGQ